MKYKFIFIIFSFFLCVTIHMGFANNLTLKSHISEDRISRYYTSHEVIPQIDRQCQEIIEKPFNAEIFASQNNKDVGFDCYIHTFVQRFSDEQFEIFEQIGEDISETMDSFCAGKNMKKEKYVENLKSAKLNMVIFFYNLIYQKKNLFIPLKTGHYLIEQCSGITQCMKQKIEDIVINNTIPKYKKDAEYSVKQLLDNTERLFIKSEMSDERLYEALRRTYNLYWDIFYSTFDNMPII
ncbi:MAG: hypothetical protein IKN71_03700 [Alphaproteobacteria bacterium]|nr:hypothetical protein [Alphaproteobacteria bacterium]